MKATVIKKMKFEAAHFLPKSSYSGPCNSLHGHSFHIAVAIRGEIDSRTGMVKDFDIIKDKTKLCIEVLDHSLLNEYISIPTSENIIIWIWEQLSKNGLYNISYIELFETENNVCIITRDDIPELLLKEWEDLDIGECKF